MCSLRTVCLQSCSCRGTGPTPGHTWPDKLQYCAINAVNTDHIPSVLCGGSLGGTLARLAVRVAPPPGLALVASLAAVALLAQAVAEALGADLLGGAAGITTTR